MKLIRLFITLCVLFFVAFADEPVVHCIAADGNYRPAGFPKSPSVLTTLGGEPIRIIWQDQAAKDNLSLTVHRVTNTRRVPLDNGTAKAASGTWSWEWIPPITRGNVTYEIVPKKEGIAPIRVLVRNLVEFSDMFKSLQSMEWESSGLEGKEIDALTALGLRIRIGIATSNQTLPFLRMTSRDSAETKRIVTWDSEKHDQVVWRIVSPSVVEIISPRWWLSPEALTTIEGRIRFLDLFSTTPSSH